MVILRARLSLWLTRYYPMSWLFQNNNLVMAKPPKKQTNLEASQQYFINQWVMSIYAVSIRDITVDIQFFYIFGLIRAYLQSLFGVHSWVHMTGCIRGTAKQFSLWWWWWCQLAKKEQHWVFAGKNNITRVRALFGTCSEFNDQRHNFWQLFIKCGLNISNVICGKDKTHRGPSETMLTFDNLRTTSVSKVSLIDEKNKNTILVCPVKAVLKQLVLSQKVWTKVIKKKES